MWSIFLQDFKYTVPAADRLRCGFKARLRRNSASLPNNVAPLPQPQPSNGLNPQEPVSSPLALPSRQTPGGPPEPLHWEQQQLVRAPEPLIVNVVHTIMNGPGAAPQQPVSSPAANHSEEPPPGVSVQLELAKAASSSQQPAPSFSAAPTAEPAGTDTVLADADGEPLQERPAEEQAASGSGVTSAPMRAAAELPYYDPCSPETIEDTIKVMEMLMAEPNSPFNPNVRENKGEPDSMQASDEDDLGVPGGMELSTGNIGAAPSEQAVARGQPAASELPSTAAAPSDGAAVGTAKERKATAQCEYPTTLC